jgi:hypothetical protein
MSRGPSYGHRVPGGAQARSEGGCPARDRIRRPPGALVRRAPTPFSQMLAVLETAAYLNLLVMQGRLRATVSGGTTGYIP